MLLLNMEVFSTCLLGLIPTVEPMTCINLILKLNNGIRYFKLRETVTLTIK